MGENGREMTFGEKAAGVNFNPSGDDKVSRIKQLSAELIDLCNEERDASTSGDVKRYYSKAISHLEDGQMNAVKAATWRF